MMKKIIISRYIIVIITLIYYRNRIGRTTRRDNSIYNNITNIDRKNECVYNILG
jgi:hypothetical protein